MIYFAYLEKNKKIKCVYLDHVPPFIFATQIKH